MQIRNRSRISLPGLGVVAGGGLGILAVLAYLTLVIGSIACTLMGLYLGFSASLVVGLIFLVLCFVGGVGIPVNLIVGLVYLVANVDLAAKLASALGV